MTHPARPGSSSWEDLCRRCGMSCHFAVPMGRLFVVIEELRCRYLSPVQNAPGTYSCDVYERRFSVAPWCHSADEAQRRGLLAHDCPYHGDRGGVGKTRVHRRLLPQVEEVAWQVVLRDGAPLGASTDGLTALATKRGWTVSGWAERGDPPRLWPVDARQPESP